MHILYGTLGCHLCDDAEAMLTQAGIPFNSIDIIDDESLLDRYGQHIPVFITDLGVCYWPFTIAQIKKLIKN